jgi:hypothetical protein
MRQLRNNFVHYSNLAEKNTSARLLVVHFIAYTVPVNTAAFPKKSRGENLSLRQLFPKLSEGDLHKVEDVFYGYLEIVWDIYEYAKRTHPERFDKARDPS